MAEKTAILLAIMTVACMVPPAQQANSTAKPITPEELESELDPFIAELLRCRSLVGLNIAVVRGNETLLTKGYGVSNLETGANVTSETLFGIASLSKAFASALLGLVLKESTQGYTWDTLVRDILGPDFYFYDAARTNNATLRDMMTHRMGFPAYNNMRHQSGLDRNTLRHKVRFMQPTLPFRAQYKYNNLMYGLASAITEAIGGDTWENLITNSLFLPLGMTSSTFTHVMDLSRKDMASSYQTDYQNDELRTVSPRMHSYWGKIGGSGSIVINANDASHWLKALINNGVNEAGDSVIPPEVLHEVFTAFETIPVGSSDHYWMKPDCPVSYVHFNYGMGWRIGYYRGWQMYHHTGSSLGYLGQITLIPDLQLAIYTGVTGSDSGYSARRLLHQYTLDLLMGEAPWADLDDACSYPSVNRHTQKRDRHRDPGNPATSDVTQYTGTYGNFAYGNVTFYVNSTTDDLMMSYGDFGVWQMVPQEGEHYFDAFGTGDVWVWDYRDIMFGHSPDGSTFDQVTITGMEQSLPPVFVRDLKMADAPEPPLLQCVTVSGVPSGYKQISWLPITWLLICATLWTTNMIH